MSLALIQESAKEVRRLAIAGSPLAVADFRLKKLAGPLEQAGTRVPVFAQVAKAINDLVNGGEADSAVNLLNLSTLLNAILYTQGESGADGDYRELEAFATTCSSTRTPARVLKPLVQALTSTGGGRFEVIKSACERGAFNDLRLIDPAIQALGDIYPELADLVAAKILPAYGPGIVPRVKAGFDLKGKKQDARKLGLMHQLDPAGTIELCKSALEDGSPEVKAAAIACLGKHEDCLPLVLDQANSKNKLHRAAALEALAEHDRPEIVKLFAELIQGKALDILAGPFRVLRNRQVLGSLLGEGKRVFGLILKGDEEQIPRYWEILDCLVHRKDPEVEEFVLACFGHCDYLAKLKAAKNSNVAGADLMFRLAGLLYGAGSPKSLEAILTSHAALPAVAFEYVLRSALRTWAADKVYVEFSPLLGQTKGAGKEKSDALQRIITATCHNGVSDNDGVEGDDTEAGISKKVDWDPRWLDAAINTDLAVVVCALARPNHKGAIAYLSKLLEVKPKNQGAIIARALGHSGLVIQALARCQCAVVTDVFLKAISIRVKGAQHIDFDLQMLLNGACHLPVADLPKLDAFAATLDEKFVDQYLEALGPLRPTQQPN